MTDNDARAYLEKSIDNVEDLPGGLTWTNAEVLELLREAVRLFEQAHTPTDDERALIEQAQSFREQVGDDANPTSLVGLWLRTASALESRIHAALAQHGHRFGLNRADERDLGAIILSTIGDGA